MQNPSLVERITRSLAYMLRHQPEQFDLELDEYGYADVDDVVSALNERLGEPVEAEDVVEAIETGDRPRYEIQGGRIRALYGHSIQVKPGETAKPPTLLYVGISMADAERARRYGLRPGRRSYLHLALTPEDALETGRRASRDYAVITVNALEAWEEGINFYDRKSLFLSDPIPTHFIQVGDVQSDGYGEEGESDRGARPRRGGAPSHDGRHDQPRSEHARRESPRQGMAREEPARREFARSEPVQSDPHANRSPTTHPDPRARTDSAPSRSGPREQDRRGRSDSRGERRPDPRGERSGRFREEPRSEPRSPREDRPATRPTPVERSPQRDRPERQEPRVPTPQPPRESEREIARERPAPAHPGSSSDAFGMGIFEAPKRKEDPPKSKVPEARPREATPPPEQVRERARGTPDGSSFGAGI